MCMYLFLLCIVFACEVCTVMVNNKKIIRVKIGIIIKITFHF